MAFDVDALSITDDYVFKDVFGQDKELCRELIEIVLGESIAALEYLVGESAIKPAFDARGVRLDVRATAADGRVFDVEMQNVVELGLARRVRYYADMLDVDSVVAGTDFEDFPDAYVVFICTFDPFGHGEPVYTFKNRCLETDAQLDDGRTLIFLNALAAGRTTGRLARLLSFFAGDASGTLDDEFLARVQDRVDRLKADRDWRHRRMTVGELIDRQTRMAKKEGFAEGLEDGFKQGREQMAALSRQLFHKLSAEGRLDDYAQALQDPALFKSLCVRYGLEETAVVDAS